MLEGYAAGLNDYAFAHPEEVLYQAAFPISPKEMISAYILSLAQMSGADRAVQAIVGGNVDLIPEDTLPKGSNAIAIHPSRTDSGETFLAINSHQPLEGPVAWYEAHLHSEEGWNALGGLFPGGSMIFHGVNEHLGWAHTVNTPDFLDLYQLKINPEDEDEYLVDGEWLELEERIVWLKVRLWDLITLPVPKKKSGRASTALRSSPNKVLSRFGLVLWIKLGPRTMVANEQSQEFHRVEIGHEFHAIVKFQYGLCG